MTRLVLSAIILVAAIQPALADECSDMSMYTDMGKFGLKDAQSYIDEQNTDLAKTEFDVLSHNLDVATQSLGLCEDEATLRKYAYADAQRWMMGHDQGWTTSETAGLRMHDDLNILVGMHENTRDPADFNPLQVAAKSYYREAGIAWDPIK